MSAAIKRRKVTATTRNTSSPVSQSRGIGAFARVSKASGALPADIERKNYDTVAITSHSTIDKKRKLLHVDEESSAEDISAITPATVNDQQLKPLPQRQNETPNTSKKLIPKINSYSSTPTKGARGLLGDLFISKPINSYFTPEPAHPTKPKTKSTSSTPELPIELVDLINLHAAFLTALSLHYAHNGTHSPADLRILLPDVARVWGKRSVTLLDIRRSLAITNVEVLKDTNDPRTARLSLIDYGHGKTCIEIRTVSAKPGRMSRPLNEDLLNEIFVRALKAAWDKRGNADMEPLEFISTLPLEAITTCPSLIKMSPLLAKGQRRLEDLKAGIIVKKESPKPASSTETPNGTKPTLVERLRAKQLHQSTLPAPPTKSDLSRRAALHRVEEVFAVLTILSTSTSIGQQRISFTLPTVLGRLRDSCKVPISREEGTTCLRLLASEVAPEWVRIVKMGKTEALVVSRNGRPTEQDITERVKRACQ